MELSRQMLLLTAVNYGSYYLHITYIISLLSTPINFIAFFIAWGILILVAQKVFEFAYLDWIVPAALLIGRILVAIIY